MLDKNLMALHMVCCHGPTRHINLADAAMTRTRARRPFLHAQAIQAHA